MKELLQQATVFETTMVGNTQYELLVSGEYHKMMWIIVERNEEEVDYNVFFDIPCALSAFNKIKEVM